MCNPKLLLLFINMCSGFISTTNYTVTQDECVRALDSCMDTYSVDYSMRYADSMDLCDDELFNRKLFSEYYSNDRCEGKLQ